MIDSAHARDQKQMVASQNESMPAETMSAQQNAHPGINHADDTAASAREKSIKAPKTHVKKHSQHEKVPSTGAPLPANVQSRIGAQMQTFYNDLLKEETPERFLKLLDELDRKSSS